MFKTIKTSKKCILLVLLFVLMIFFCLCTFKSISIKETANVDSVTLPIVMYHSMLNDKSLQNSYCIDPDIFEADLKYLEKNGYTTVTIKDLLNYVKGKPLPKKIIMLTFDDGFYNNYTYAYPLLKKYKSKGVISPVASYSLEYSQNNIISASYGYCSFEVLKEMEESGYVEIANHSFNMHKTSPRLGIAQIKNETDEEYKKTLYKDIRKAQRLFVKNNIKKPLCFTYPFGSETKNTLPLLKKLGFKCTLTCFEKTNIIYRDKNCLYELGRYLRNGNESSQNFFERICN